MTIAQIQKRLAAIKTLADAGDYEAAHSAEDKLHIDALKAIAQGTLTLHRARIVATLAVQSDDIRFPRYCA